MCNLIYPTASATGRVDSCPLKTWQAKRCIVGCFVMNPI